MAFKLLNQSSSPTFELNERNPASEGEGWGGCWPRGEAGSAVSGIRVGVSVSVGSSYSLPDGPRWRPPGSRWDSVVSSVTAGEGWSGLMHNGGSADHTTTWLPHWCGSSSITVSILQGYWNINCCIRTTPLCEQQFIRLWFKHFVRANRAFLFSADWYLIHSWLIFNKISSGL